MGYMDFMKKYLKYKKKYIQLKNQLGGEKYNEHDIIIGLNGYIDPKYENDEDYILTAIDKKKDIKVLFYISDKLKGSVDFFKKVVKINGLGLQHGNRDIKNNKEIVLAAVEQNGEVLKIFPRARIININRDIVLAAVTQNGKAFYYVRMFSDSFERFKKDKEIVCTAVKTYGLALEYAGEQFKKDKDIVLAAVENNGLALKYAEQNLKNDKEIVLAAVTNNYLAIRFMDSSLNNDIEISVEVYKQNSDYIKNFSEDVQDYIKKNYK